MQIEINEKWCKGCGICQGLCPRKVFKLTHKPNVHVKDNEHPYRKIQYLPIVFVENPDACVDCGMCESHCPEFAIRLVR